MFFRGLMNTTIDFEQYKKDALANKAAAKEALRIKENARQVKKRSKGGASVSKKGSQVAVGLINDLIYISSSFIIFHSSFV